MTKSGNGQVLLTANITACGATTSKNYSIYVGLPQPASSIDFYGNGYDGGGCTENKRIRAEAVVSLSNTGYEWYLGTGITSSASGGSNPFTLGSSGLDIPIYVNTTSTSYVRVRTINACGMSSPTFGYISLCSSFAKGEESQFSVSSNPTSGIVTIDTKGNKIIELQLVDKSGNLKLSQKYLSGKSSTTIDISSLSADTYYLQIYDGLKWETKQVMKLP